MGRQKRIIPGKLNGGFLGLLTFGCGNSILAHGHPNQET